MGKIRLPLINSEYEYYKKYDIDVENFTSTTVGRRSTLQIDYNVNVIDSVIR
jgi:hypothetical protein